MKKSVAVIGIKDTFCGQIVNSRKFQNSYEVHKFLTTEIPILVEEDMHEKNPVKTCEYPKNRKIYGKDIIEKEKIWQYLDEQANQTKEEMEIEGIFVLEDSISERKQLIEKIRARYKDKINILTWISDTAKVDETSIIGLGSIIMHDVYIGYKAEIGIATTIQTGSIIEHHSKIGNYVNICPGFLCGSFIDIGDEVQVNIGVTMFNRVAIGQRCCIGAGSLVNKDCESRKLYFGRPAKAKRVWN